MILLPTAYFGTPEVLLESTQQPGTADNDINFLNRFGLKINYNQYATDDDAWFGLPEPNERGLKMIWSEKFNSSQPDTDARRQTTYYTHKLGFAAGCSDARYIWGTSGGA
jgi:hypothetical protein